MGIFAKLMPKKRVGKTQLFVPKFLRTARAGGAAISNTDTNQTNTDLTSLRYGATTESIVRDYAKNSPDVSHALETFIRFAITDSYTIIAKDVDTGVINPAATVYAQMFANRIDKLPPVYGSYQSPSSLAGNSESLVSQMLTNGCAMAELVIGKAGLPSHIVVVSTNELKYEDKGGRAVPYIEGSDKKIYLDSPAVQSVVLTQDPDNAYASSWFKAAVQSIIANAEFTDDLRRSFRKASLPRVTAEIDVEKFKESLSPETLYDPEQFSAAMNTVISQIEDQLNGLNPEDCIVTFDTVKVDHLSAGNISAHESVNVHAKIVDGQMSTGLHCLPSLLGRGESQSTASSEAVLFLKLNESLQGRLNELYSGLFTLGARLAGHDVVVEFKYKKPSLRPEIEEESFKSMAQSRILQQLSLGLISDEEASIALTGDLPSGNYKPLSGTMFMDNKVAQVENPYSNTSVGDGQVNKTKTEKDRSKTDTQPKTNKTTG